MFASTLIREESGRSYEPAIGDQGTRRKHCSNRGLLRTEENTSA
jgi:hypothetical protein